MKLINLTKHTVMLYDTRGEAVEIMPDARHLGVVAIGEHRSVTDESGHSFSVNVRYIKEVKGLPEPEPDTMYIVPTEVAMALQERRDDLVFAAEDAQVRNNEGGLQRVTHLRRVISRIPERS
jgi:hypothetical protein